MPEAVANVAIPVILTILSYYWDHPYLSLPAFIEVVWWRLFNAFVTADDFVARDVSIGLKCVVAVVEFIPWHAVGEFAELDGWVSPIINNFVADHSVSYIFLGRLLFCDYGWWCRNDGCFPIRCFSGIYCTWLRSDITSKTVRICRVWQ